MNHLLSILLLLPAIGAAAILLLPRARLVKWTALGTTLLTFVISVVVLFRFDTRSPGTYGYAASHGVVQFVERAAWIRSLHSFYLVGIDGLSLPLVLLTTFIFPLACAASWKIDKATKRWFLLLLLLEASILGVFLSLDLLQFFIFLEVSLIPIYLLIGIWGGPRKAYATIKFAACMAPGSAAMLIALTAICLDTRSFDMIELPALLSAQFAHGGGTVFLPFLFPLLMLAIFIRMPAVPFHSWFLDVQAEAPAAVSMIVAALMLKISGYVIFRVAYPLFPEAARHFWLPLALIGTVSILYSALCAMFQNDFKKLLAYNSISQMGFVTLGAAMMTPAAINGSLFLLLAHGISSAMMLFSAGVLADRARHRDLARFGGLASTMPRLFGLSIVGVFATIGVPLLCGFVGEVLILLGIFQTLRPTAVLFVPGFAFRGKMYSVAILAMVGLVLTAGCMLKAVQRIFFGRERPELKEFADIDHRETTILASLAGMSLLLGIFPGVFVFSMTGRTVEAIFGLFDKSTSAATQATTDPQAQQAAAPR